MKTFKVSYSGTNSRYRNFKRVITATCEREAVEKVYQQTMDANYFPQDDGTIQDCSGVTIASATDTTIEYDGGCFTAEEVNYPPTA